MQLPADTDTASVFSLGRVPAFELIENELGRVSKLIDEQVTFRPDKPEVARLVKDFISTKGKMLRPGLLLLAGKCSGRITNTHVRAAAVMELIHNATLLHDDVIDQGQSRRGKPTVNKLWGNESAVLLGDFLLSRVFEMCTRLKPEVVRIIAANTARICRGELTQVHHRQNWQLSESEYIEIITDKSASLFACCCRLGAVLSGAGEQLVRRLAQFGLNLGIAFQLADDLLDIIGTESQTGKTVGSDVDTDKPTLAVTHLLRVVSEKDKTAVLNALRGDSRSKETLIKMLRRYGSLEYTRSRCREFVDKAVAELAEVSDSKAAQALIKTAEFAAKSASQTYR